MRVERQLQVEAERWSSRVLQALSSRGIYYVSIKNHDKIRLLNWKVWCIRYEVSLDFLLDVLLQAIPVPRDVRRKGRLGRPIATLTGRAAQEKIESFVERNFPSGENRDAKRSELQTRMLDHNLTLNPRGFHTLPGYLNKYERLAERRRRQRAIAAHRFKRPWRGNPWI